MLLLLRIVHVLAVGLWFGTTVFFTFVVGLSLFRTFEDLSTQPAAERPYWFPVPPQLERDRPSSRFPEPLRKEQGSRVAGAAVGHIFPWYFGIQVACGILALLTALVLHDPAAGARLYGVRLGVLVLALVTVGVGWWMERVIDEIRVRRSSASDVVLQSPAPSAEQVQQADAVRAEFGRWHGYSLLLNFLTIFLVTVAMAFTAVQPAATGVSHGADLAVPAGGRP